MKAAENKKFEKEALLILKGINCYKVQRCSLLCRGRRSKTLEVNCSIDTRRIPLSEFTVQTIPLYNSDSVHAFGQTWPLLRDSQRDIVYAVPMYQTLGHGLRGSGLSICTLSRTSKTDLVYKGGVEVKEFSRKPSRD